MHSSLLCLVALATATLAAEPTLIPACPSNTNGPSNVQQCNTVYTEDACENSFVYKDGLIAYRCKWYTAFVPATCVSTTDECQYVTREPTPVPPYKPPPTPPPTPAPPATLEPAATPQPEPQPMPSTSMPTPTPSTPTPAGDSGSGSSNTGMLIGIAVGVVAAIVVAVGVLYWKRMACFANRAYEAVEGHEDQKPRDGSA